MYPYIINNTNTNNNTSLAFQHHQEPSTTQVFNIKKHEYEFNTPDKTDGLASEIVSILVSSILSSYDKKLT